MRRALPAAIGLMMLAAACSGDTPLAPSSTSRPPGSTADPTGPTTTTTTTGAPGTAPSSTTTTGPDPEPSSHPGGSGLGDPYFPELGNGGYDVEHYLIDLDVDPNENLIEGTVTIEAAATENLSAFNLDLIGLQVGEVSVDGSAVPHHRLGSELVVAAALPAGEAFSVAVEYSGRPEAYQTEEIRFPMGWIRSAGGTFVASQPAGARTWFPSNDHPSDKATFTFVITVPESFAAAANGRLVETIEAEDATTFVWEADDPMATYLATVVVAELERVESPGPAGVVLRDYLRPGLAADPPEAFGLVAEMLAVFEPAFGPYPFDTYGHVVVPDWPAALETQTLTVFGDDWLDASFVEYVVAHELAHSWFGNSVTPATWRDIWLSEGFATFAEWVWLEHRGGREAMLAQIRQTYDELEGETVALTGDPGAGRMFGDAVYLRGGLTLHALRVELGDELLFEVLRSWTERFSHGNATTRDFVALAEELAERELDDLFQAWLYQHPLPPFPEP